MTLAEAGELTEEGARAYLEAIRWPDGPVCVKCGNVEVTRLQGKATRPGVLKCKGCRQQFTVTVGTIFEDSHLPLRKWVLAFHLMCGAKKGISALQLKRHLGIAYKSAWHMAHRIRHAMQAEPLRSMLSGTVEVDETYVGGKPRFRHRRHSTKPRPPSNKVPVVALVERGGKVRTRVVADVTAKTLKDAIRENVARDSRIMTDEHKSYEGIGRELKSHDVVKHGHGQYVRGDAYTNTAESFFGLLKRGVMGAFHHVSKEHLPRYCEEFAYRWNTRHATDSERTAAAIRQTEGRRLMYRGPTL